MHEQNMGIINNHDIQCGKNEVGDQFLYQSQIKIKLLHYQIFYLAFPI